jgi:hypothetical protein
MALPIVQSHSEPPRMSDTCSAARFTHRTRRADVAAVDASECSDRAPQVTYADAPVVRALGAGLDDVERRTWWRLLDGWPIAAIAHADQVSRTAIYYRIRGSAGQRGMTAKNRWVALWWAAARVAGRSAVYHSFGGSSRRLTSDDATSRRVGIGTACHTRVAKAALRPGPHYGRSEATRHLMGGLPNSHA